MAGYDDDDGGDGGDDGWRNRITTTTSMVSWLICHLVKGMSGILDPGTISKGFVVSVLSLSVCAVGSSPSRVLIRVNRDSCDSQRSVLAHASAGSFANETK